MPELPEVETTRRGIAPLVVGRRVDGHARVRPAIALAGSRVAPANASPDARSTPLDRRSKYLLFPAGRRHAARPSRHDRQPAGVHDPPPRSPHDHVDIVLDSGVTLRYHDPRRFGAMLWLPPPAEAHPLLAALGPEPFDAAFDADYLWRATARRTAAIKLALMDNHLVVGVGNIYANESLFRAGIRPTTPAHRVSRPRLGAARRRGPRDAGRRDRQGRIDAARLRRQPGRARLLPARLLRLRPAGPAVPRLRHRHPADPAGRPGDELLPALPALTARRPGCACVRLSRASASAPPARDNHDRQATRMVPPRELAARFEAYGDWRRRLASGVSALHEWLRGRTSPTRRSTSRSSSC